MFAKRPLKTYSRLKRRVVEPERDRDRECDDSPESGGGDDDVDDVDVEEDNRRERKRRRIECFGGTGNAMSVAGSKAAVGVTTVEESSDVGSAVMSGVMGSDLSEGACGAMRKSFPLSSSSSSSFYSSRGGEFVTLSSTPPSSPPPLMAMSVSAVTSCEPERKMWLGGVGRRAMDGGFTDENCVSLPAAAAAATATMTATTGASDTAKVKPLAHRSANVPSKLFSSRRRVDARAKMKSTATAKAKAKLKNRDGKSQLTQLCIDLGNNVRKTCRTCGMDYIASSAEDVALHKKFHSMNMGGVDVPRWFVDGGDAAPRKLWSEGWDETDAAVSVVAVDRRDSIVARNVAVRVIDVANRELSAVQIGDAELWGRVGMGDEGGEGREGGRRVDGPIVREEGYARGEEAERKRDHYNGTRRGADRFKVYLYLRGHKCVGLCLVERISKAYRTLPDSKVKEANVKIRISKRSPLSASDPLHSESSSLQLSSSLPSSLTSISYASLDEISHPAIMGISRIWTSNSHRRQGIAKRLLDCAASSFLYGMSIEQESIAFSQPTESGSKLASSWFGKMDGWHVYT